MNKYPLYIDGPGFNVFWSCAASSEEYAISAPIPGGLINDRMVITTSTTAGTDHQLFVSVVNNPNKTEANLLAGARLIQTDDRGPTGPRAMVPVGVGFGEAQRQSREIAVGYQTQNNPVYLLFLADNGESTVMNTLASIYTKRITWVEKG